jgi:galactokinase/mevalonate kinase-like predicted kinase
MLRIKTPFRVSFADGSSDLPAFYEKNGCKALFVFK